MPQAIWRPAALEPRRVTVLSSDLGPDGSLASSQSTTLPSSRRQKGNWHDVGDPLQPLESSMVVLQQMFRLGKVAFLPAPSSNTLVGNVRDAQVPCVLPLPCGPPDSAEESIFKAI